MRLLRAARESCQLATRYLAESCSVLRRRAERPTLRTLARLYPAWRASLRTTRDPLSDASPWVTFPAIEALKSMVTRDSRIFEFGAGGSTVFFAGRAASVATVEHDAAWLAATAERVAGLPGASWQQHLAPPESAAADEDAYASTDARFAGMSFKGYAGAIDRYPNGFFDVVLIDGRARPACFVHAVPKVKLGGYIVLDNAERAQYALVEHAAAALGFEMRGLWGPGPYNQYFWRTLFLRKTRDYHALNDLDRKLERHLDFDGGTFVEAGANDGVSQSNTLYLEQYRGWRGLLVEPVPELAAKCRRLRPRAIVEQAALVAAGDPRAEVALRYANLMTTVKGAMRSTAEEDAHIEAGTRVQSLARTYEVRARAATLSELLDRHGLQRLDLLSLDVEGYEGKALRGLDLGRHVPRYILVEARYRPEVEELLAPRYELVEALSFHDLLFRARP